MKTAKAVKSYAAQQQYQSFALVEILMILIGVTIGVVQYKAQLF